MQSRSTDSARLARRSVGFFLLIAIAWTLYVVAFSPTGLTRSQVAELVAPVVRANEFPQFIKMNESDENSAVLLEYTVQPEGQAFIKRLIESYHPDYGAFVALDAESGEILAMVSYTKQEKTGLGNLALKATFPAASIFKVITAAAAVDRAMMTPDTVVPFNGASHTLYRRQVFDNKQNRWTRYITLKEAFGKSINPVFAKVGIQHLDSDVLLEYARRFKFSSPFPTDVPVETSRFNLPADNNWKMAEIASGFNRDSTLSPLHGAMIAAAIVNDGEMMVPHLVNRVFDRRGGMLYEANPEVDSKVIDPASAKKLRQMMAETVRNGTSRRMFRDLMRMPAFENVEFGGKTGSLMGTLPEGKTDWFVGYAKTPHRKIAVASITVHKQYWTVRSAYLARRYFESLLQYKEQRQARRFLGKRRS